MDVKMVGQTIKMVAIGFVATLLLAGCEQMVTPQTTADRVATIGFSKSGKPMVLNENGRPAKETDQEGKVVSEVKITFQQVNPCVVEICGETICKSYLISSGPCPPGF